MPLKLFDVDDIMLIHMQIIDASSGAQGVRDKGRLDAVVASQAQSVYGKELHESLHDRAAALMRGIIADHPFSDGNKRTGMMSALIFLERNGVPTTVEDQELEDFAVRVAVERLDVPTTAAWLKANSRA